MPEQCERFSIEGGGRKKKWQCQGNIESLQDEALSADGGLLSPMMIEIVKLVRKIEKRGIRFPLGILSYVEMSKCYAEMFREEITDALGSMSPTGEVDMGSCYDIFAPRHLDNFFKFLQSLELWGAMPLEWRRKYPSVEAMQNASELELADDEAEKRGISTKQWLDLLHIANATGFDVSWVDKSFHFSGEGKITAKKKIDLGHCDRLTTLPEELIVSDTICLNHCTALPSLPESLEAGNLILSKNMQSRVLLDARRLEDEGRIKSLSFSGNF